MGGPFQIVSDVYAEELEAFQLEAFHCGPIDVDRGVLPLLFPEVHDQLLVSSANLMIELEACVMVEQEVQEEAEHVPLWGPCVEDQ